MMLACLVLILENMNNHQKWTVNEVIFAIAALVFILFLQGAIPFVMIPTLGQAVWTTGFATSYTHSGFFTIYAHDFGLPKPAPIAFGLPGAWLTSVLLRLGLHAADAYAMMMLLCFSFAFFAAYAMARKFGNTRRVALLGAVTWMSMPIIWNHAGYSMLALGMSLLPFYFLMAMKFFLPNAESNQNTPSYSMMALYFVTVVVSAFMDGYTFIMFFSGATIIFLFLAKTRVELRPILWRKVFPVHMVSFIGAYIFYSLFIGRLHFTKAPIDVFRSFGLDLSFVVFPTKGVHWLPDLLGLSWARPSYAFFGDASSWTTTFSLPIMLAGLVAWWLTRKKSKLMTGIFLIAIFGFYMSLGPSLKINTMRPLTFQTTELAKDYPLMTSDLAVMPTANAWIFKAVPGFNNTRSVYRWSALWIFAFWWLVMISFSQAQRKITWTCVLLTVIVFNLPNLPEKFRKNSEMHTMFFHIDQDLIPALKLAIEKNSVVAFLPWGNDFFANYLAPAAGFRTYNIGGDKNLLIAQHYWPEAMLNAGPAPLDTQHLLAGIQLLRDKNADVLVLPYFDLLWAAHEWSCSGNGDVSCTLQRKQEMRPMIVFLYTLPDVEVTEGAFFATIKLRNNLEKPG